MNDADRKLLFDHAYRIFRCCGLCKFADIKPGDAWGRCMAPELNGMKIHQYGKCDQQFRLDKDKLKTLEGHAEFIRE